jgi:ribokinase
MLASYLGKGRVAMIGKTAKDPFHLWSVPFKALKASGVNTDYISVESYKKTGKLPGLALIPVDTKGNNQIYVLPGINSDFSPDYLKKCEKLFQAVGKNGGFLGVTLELPLETAVYAMELAEGCGMKTVLDPGGIGSGEEYMELLKRNIYLIKPNEHEAETLTGVNITGLSSARKAARKLFDLGIQHVLITHGENGGYLITGETAIHIPVPESGSEVATDTTGCGDQVTATLMAELIANRELETAATTAVAAGSIQATRMGIEPVRKTELESFMEKNR